MANIAGITIEFNSDVTGISKGIKDIEAQSTDLQKQITKLNRNLKFDAGNVEIVAQKMDMIGQAAVSASADVTALKQMQDGMDAANVDKSSEAYRKLEREIAIAESKAKSFNDQYATQMKTAPIEAVQRAFDLLKEDIASSDKELEKLKAEQAKMDAAGVDKTSAEYVKLQQKIEQAEQKNTALKENLKQLEQIKGAREAGESFEDLGEGIDDAAESADNASGSFDDVNKGLSDLQTLLVSAGLMTAVKELAGAFEECVKTSMEFEQTMSQVSALSGATGSDLDALSDKAKELGASTKYTAAEAASAFSYMALAGWDTAEMLDGISGVLDLAAASEMDLGQASDIVTDYLTAFGLSAQDAGRFADQMAYAMANSNTTTAQLGEAYKNVAATAKSMGFSVEDTTAAIMTMSNAGVKGGEAGTALSAIMTRLATNAKECADGLAEYGINVRDEEGNMRTLSDILTDMASGWETMSSEEQAALSKAVAGTGHYAALQTVLDGASMSLANGSSSLIEYADALANCEGSASDMAVTMQDNLSGSITQFNSAMDGLKNEIGTQLTPAVQGVTEAGTELVRKVNELIQGNSALVPIITGAATALGAMTAATSALAVATKIYNALKAEETFMSMLTPIGLASAAIGALAAAMIYASSQTSDAEKQLDSFKEKVSTSSDAWAQTTAEFDSNKASTAAMVATLTELMAVQEKDATTIAEINAVCADLNSSVDGLNLAYDEQSDSLNQNIDDIDAYIEAMFREQQATDIINEIINEKKLQAEAENNLTDAQNRQADAAERLAEGEGKLSWANHQARSDYDEATGQITEYSDAMTAASDRIAELEAELAALQGENGGVEDTAIGAANALDTETESAEGAADGLEEVDDAAQKAHDAIYAVGEACIDASGTGDELMAQYESLTKEFEKNADACDTATKSYVEHLLQQLKLEAMTKQLAEQLPMLGESYSGLASAIDAAGYSVDEFVKDYNSAFTSIVNGFDNLELNSDNTLKAWIDSMNQRQQITDAWNQNMTVLTDCAVNASEHPILAASTAYQQAIQTMMDGGIETYGTAAQELAAAISRGDYSMVQQLCAQINAAGTAANTAAMNEFALATGLTVEQINTLMAQGALAVENGGVVIKDAAALAAEGVATGLESGESSAETAAADLVGAAADAVLGADVSSAYENGGKALGEYMASGISEKAETVSSAIQSMLSAAVASAAATAQTEGQSIGRYFDAGLAAGIYSNASLVRSAAASVAASAASAARAAIKVSSPSKVAMEIGKYFSEGMAKGITNGQQLVEAASAAMANAATVTARSNVPSVTNNNSYGGSTINISVDGAGGNAQEVASIVMDKINSQIARQRGGRR